MRTNQAVRVNVDLYEKYRIDSCRICGSPDLFEYLTLADMPIPNGFLREEDLNNEEPRYPLRAYVCRECTLSQLTHVVPAEIMFRNYLYIPSTSTSMVNHFKSFAAQAVERCGVLPRDLVIDIGSNDGTLLNAFKTHEATVLGIDPAENLAKLARLNGVDTIADFFSEATAKKVVKEREVHAKVITGTNVMAHVPDVHDFLRGVKALLAEDGTFIGEFPYGKDMHDKNEFDTIYHEHLSYFNVRSLQVLFEEHDLRMVDIVKQPIHGGSLRVFVKHRSSATPTSPVIDEFLADEAAAGMQEDLYYDNFAQRVESIKHDLTHLLSNLKRRSKRIVGYGAAAKGNVLLNHCNIGPDKLDYIVDSVSFKQGRFTPGTHIPIHPEERLQRDNPDYILLLAWNFADEIIAKQADFRHRGGQFILAIPHVHIR